MPDPNQMSATQSSNAPVNPTSLPAGKTAPTGKSSSSNSDTKINSLAELQEKAPEVWKAMLEGLAMNICNKMRDSQERLKQMMREAERNGK